jgi:hypothetical protein
MTGRDCDIAIVGGGLAGGLIALALARLRPELAVRLFEADSAPGGNHRWSWFASDLSADGHRLLDRFRLARWDEGYDVRFPGLARRLSTPCRSLASPDFAEGLAHELPAATIAPAPASSTSGRPRHARLGRPGCGACGDRLPGVHPHAPPRRRLAGVHGPALAHDRAARDRAADDHGRDRRAARRLPVRLRAPARPP